MERLQSKNMIMSNVRYWKAFSLYLGYQAFGGHERRAQQKFIRELLLRFRNDEVLSIHQVGEMLEDYLKRHGKGLQSRSGIAPEILLELTASVQLGLQGPERRGAGKHCPVAVKSRRGTS